MQRTLRSRHRHLQGQIVIVSVTKQEAFEKCWAHSPLRAAARPNFTLPFTRCRYCRVARRLRIDVHDSDDNNDNA